MAKFISIPRARGSKDALRINVDNITYYNGTAIYLVGQYAVVTQTVSSDELDGLIRIAQADMSDMMEPAAIPVLR